MNQAEVSRFIDYLRAAPSLVAEVKALLDDPDAAIRWAGERGFHFTEEDIRELREDSRDLSDDDLDQVAGGDDAWVPPPH